MPAMTLYSPPSKQSLQESLIEDIGQSAEKCTEYREGSPQPRENPLHAKPGLRLGI